MDAHFLNKVALNNKMKIGTHEVFNLLKIINSSKIVYIFN